MSVKNTGESVKLEVLKTDGSSSGEQATLAPAIFGIEPNDHAIWLAVTAELTNRRQGTSSTKNRSAVSGGGKKPWRQKGRGTARAGTSRSPVWVGGGRTFGPSPRNYHKKLTKKMSQLARRSALSHKAKDENIRLVVDFNFEAPKTKEMAEILTKIQLNDKKVLVLVPGGNQSVYLSGRNIPKVQVKEAANVSTYDILNAEMLLIQQSALEKINEVLG